MKRRMRLMEAVYSRDSGLPRQAVYVVHVDNQSNECVPSSNTLRPFSSGMHGWTRALPRSLIFRWLESHGPAAGAKISERLNIGHVDQSDNSPIIGGLSVACSDRVFTLRHPKFRDALASLVDFHPWWLGSKPAPPERLDNQQIH